MNPYLPRGSAADGPYALAVGPERAAGPVRGCE